MNTKTGLLFLFFFCFGSFAFAQKTGVTVSGLLKEKGSQAPLAYANVLIKTEKDSVFVTGTVTDEEGRYRLSGVQPGRYFLEFSFVGFRPKNLSVFVGSLSDFLEIPPVEIEEESQTLEEVTVIGKEDAISEEGNKKTFSLADNLSQSGGSVLQSLQNLPGITVQDGKVLLRGNDRITVLIDGKQTAMTGFGTQTGLDNLPASAIEKIEIITNPSAKYEANGNAGIINIIYKKNKTEGLNGKIGMTAGLGAWQIKKENLPGIRSQYQFTPKINPSLSLNYRKNKINVFFQGDYFLNQTLNKNEFTDRSYSDGSTIRQQLKRNRSTHYGLFKTGLDWQIDAQNSLTVSALYGVEKILDRGDQPFFNADFSERFRLWQFLEDELKTTVTGSANFLHKFKEPGKTLSINVNYTFHREDEKYYFDNILPTYAGEDAFKLISDEQVIDLGIDYVRPLKYGRAELGFKFRNRGIPTDMQFFPGLNSPLDSAAGGKANYRELIPAAYGNYVFENEKIEAEIGLRLEYADIQYEVGAGHPTYKSDGYNYVQPFPSVRLAYKINENNKISLFFNRRVDRPNEVDIRIFPKYDDAEIIKVGNPALRPQFTNSVELGYKTGGDKSYFYAAVFHRFADGTITRISSTVPGSKLIYAVFQNVNRSYNSGAELLFSREISERFTLNLNLTAYRNQIDAFTVENKYPVLNTFTAARQDLISGNMKFNGIFRFSKSSEAQLSAVYLAPDLIPQGKMAARFSLDFGFKKSFRKSELTINATDLLNTMVIKREIQGSNFNYISSDYYETQVVRLGWSLKF